MPHSKRLGVLLVAAALTVTAAACGGSDEQAAAGPSNTSVDFRGKTITLITDGGPGSGQDLRTRSTALSLHNLLPGHPRVIVQNISGGGGARGLRELNSSPKDGTVLMDVHGRWFVRDLVGSPDPLYAPNEQLIGAVGVKTEGQALWVWEDVAKNWDEVLSHGCCLKIAEGAKDATNALLQYAETKGAPFDIIWGYADDSKERAAAFFRHETDAAALSPQDIDKKLADKIVPVTWWGELAPLDYDELQPLLANKGITENPPFFFDAMNVSPEDKNALEVATKATRAHRGAFAVPQGTPTYIREFWEKMLAEVAEDPGYADRLLAQGENPSDFGYASRADILAYTNQVNSLPPAQFALLKELLKEEV